MNLTNTSVAGILIDAADADLNSSRWSLTSTGYVRRGAVAAGGRRRESRLHRIIAARMLGRPLAPGEVVDHINGNVLDNRRANLRVCTHAENLRNQVNRRRATSGYIGVAKAARRCVHDWRAYIVLDAKQFHIGTFATPEEAAWMYDQWALSLHGEFARLNLEYVLHSCSFHNAKHLHFASKGAY